MLWKKRICLLVLKKWKKILSLIIVCKGKSPKIILNKNEIDCMKKRMIVLDETRKKMCFWFKQERFFVSKEKDSREMFTTSTTHKVRSQNTTRKHQAYLYNKVYIYTHCGRKGHLAQFCYSRLNLRNKNIWIWKDTSPQGHKMIWVLKNTPILLDVRVSSSKT